ncbi:hypothetical protein J4032_01100 [Streptomyces formicae]|uniref:Uncharacterized protein n=1 Tax=Streptomyces formicae TaxID=1616117 RepID=A0ABY3WCL2_9ACTN|nr:hypothetical protein [Streptomyces formicae]UNM10292.1 hypothetical protein J4032_01100 [Streptomyces formicae]
MAKLGERVAVLPDRPTWRRASAAAWSPSPPQAVAAADSHDSSLHRIHAKDGAER